MLFPTVIVPGVGFIYLIVWYFAWQKPQTKFVKAHWGKDYPRKPWSIPLLIGFGCWGALLALNIVLAMLVAQA